MKRFLALLLTLVMLSSVSVAETLSIDTSTATESEVTDMMHINKIMSADS